MHCQQRESADRGAPAEGSDRVVIDGDALGEYPIGTFGGSAMKDTITLCYARHVFGSNLPPEHKFGGGGLNSMPSILSIYIDPDVCTCSQACVFECPEVLDGDTEDGQRAADVQFLIFSLNPQTH